MPSVIGLDLGQHAFRAVQVDRSKKGTFIEKSGVYDSPKIDLEAGDKEYSHAVKDFVKETGFTTSKVVLSLEEKEVFMRVIDVPTMGDKELRSSISIEAEQYIPLPLNEVNLSYQKLDIPISSPGKMSVQIVAAKKNVLQKYIHIVKDAKLTPVGVEPEALAVARVLSNPQDTSANLILQLGYRKSLIIISLKGQVLFTRTLSMGGDAMTRGLSQNLGLEYVQAEEYKKAYGLSANQAEGKIYNVLKPMFDSISSEVGRSQIFFTTRYPGVSINKVLLSGGTALMPGLLLYMANSLNIEVELANPFGGVEFSKDLVAKRDWHIENGPLFACPLGLALKEI